MTEQNTPESSTPESSTPESSTPETSTPETNTPETSHSESVSRDDFNGLVAQVSGLTEKVASLLDRLAPSNSSPVKVPWTHIGSRKAPTDG